VDEATRASGPEVGEEKNGRTPEQIRADIEETRRDLGDTVEELAAKTDVKAHAKAKVEAVKQSRAPLIAAGALAVVIVGVVLAKRR
jgi:exopolyphosphatase/pppGpp-phosphohydrolase